MSRTLENLCEVAKDGDRVALEALIRGIQDKVYNLAIRMLWSPADAEDASQEILVKVITHLTDFRHESSFTTWVYRIASNHLLSLHRRRAERRELTFDQCEVHIDKGLSQTWTASQSDAEQHLITKEIMISCTQALLLCLDRNHRIAYVLGGIFEVTGKQGGYILGIEAAAFRKRVSRARGLLRDFLMKNCGVMNPESRCQCSQMMPQAIEQGWANPKHLLFADHPQRGSTEVPTREQLTEMNEIQRVAALYRSHPDYAAPEDFINGLKDLLDSGRFQIFSH